MSHDKVQLVRGAREKRKVTSFGEKVLTAMTRTIALVLACLTACNVAAAPQDGGAQGGPQGGNPGGQPGGDNGQQYYDADYTVVDDDKK